MSSIRPTVITGKANTNRIEVTKVIQTNNGIRINVMPGARKLIIVTTKLNAAAKEATPSTCKPNAQKSIPLPKL